MCLPVRGMTQGGTRSAPLPISAARCTCRASLGTEAGLRGARGHFPLALPFLQSSSPTRGRDEGVQHAPGAGLQYAQHRGLSEPGGDACPCRRAER